MLNGNKLNNRNNERLSSDRNISSFYDFVGMVLAEFRRPSWIVLVLPYCMLIRTTVCRTVQYAHSTCHISSHKYYTEFHSKQFSHLSSVHVSIKLCTVLFYSTVINTVRRQPNGETGGPRSPITMQQHRHGASRITNALWNCEPL